MLNRFIASLIIGVGTLGMVTTPSLFPQHKIHDPAKKAQIAKEIKFWEVEYTEALVRRYDIKNKTGDFADIDPGIYDEFEMLVEHDFENTEDQLARFRSEYQRYQ